MASRAHPSSGPDTHALLARYEVVPIASLKAHPSNYLTHPSDQRDHLEASLTTHGQYKNVVTADDLTLLAGHGVVDAARGLGHTHIVIQRMPYAPDDDQALALLVGDNGMAKMAHERDRELATLLAGLQDRGGDDALRGTGFDALMVEALRARDDVTRAPDVQAPDAFPSVDASLQTDYCCPQCGYEWSGKAT